MCAKVIIGRTSRICRLVSLSMLVGGSIAVIISAITVVRQAVTVGMAGTVAEAAVLNAPVFILFSKIALGAAFVLLLGESLAYAEERTRISKLHIARYCASILSIAAAMVFAFVFVPPMQQLLPDLKTNPAAHQEFHRLHEGSRGVFGAMILCALISLILPAFEWEDKLEDAK